jgi:hypothetical protein
MGPSASSDEYTAFAEVGKETADSATVKMDENIVVGVNPLLLNAEGRDAAPKTRVIALLEAKL